MDRIDVATKRDVITVATRLMREHGYSELRTHSVRTELEAASFQDAVGIFESEFADVARLRLT